MARAEHDVVLTLPASGAFAAVARQAALELARRRNFAPTANEALATAVGDAFDHLTPSDDQVQLTFAIVEGAIVVSASLLAQPDRSFRRAVPGR
ncbi:MAG: hypothetical protein GEV08_04060 [Acidimicrobiia bacterium]|nr:hypothetical protein [Acidimicrobiia bacterium]